MGIQTQNSSNTQNSTNKFLCHVCISESTPYSCLNVKELLTQSRCKIWSLSHCNWTQTHNPLVHKRTLNHLAMSIHSQSIYDMIRTYSQMHCTDKYSQHSSIILASLAKLSGCGLESSCNRTKKQLDHFFLIIPQKY